MSVDRSKLKATPMSNLKQQDEQTNSLRNQSDRADYLKIDNGTNRFRIYPGHDGEAFILPKVVSWLPQEVTKKDKNGKETKSIERRPVFNSRIHAGTKQDLVEEYVAFVRRKLAEDKLPPAECDEKLKPITFFKTSPSPKAAWVMYADKITGNGKTFGRLEIGAAIKEAINKIAMTEDVDEPIQVDPFSDPDEGRCIIITKNDKSEKPQDYYATAIDFRKSTPLSDDDLEHFMKFDPLHKQFKNSFKRSDFEKQLNGLKLFDEEHGYGMFEYDEWLAVCEKMSALYPQEEDKDEKEIKAQFSGKSSKAEVKTATAYKAKVETKSITQQIDEETEEEIEEIEEEVDGDEFDQMDRTGLKIYNRDKGLGIAIKQSYSDDQIRQVIREAIKAKNTDDSGANDLPWDNEGNDKPGFGSKAVAKATSVTEAPVNKVSAMRDRLKGKK